MKVEMKVAATTQKKPQSNYSFTNGNIILPFSVALKAGYTFKEVADILGVDCNEVCKQFNNMAKASGYNLF